MTICCMLHPDRSESSRETSESDQYWKLVATLPAYAAHLLALHLNVHPLDLILRGQPVGQTLRRTGQIPTCCLSWMALTSFMSTSSSLVTSELTHSPMQKPRPGQIHACIMDIPGHCFRSVWCREVPVHLCGSTSWSLLRLQGVTHDTTLGMWGCS